MYFPVLYFLLLLAIKLSVSTQDLCSYNAFAPQRIDGMEWDLLHTQNV